MSKKKEVTAKDKLADLPAAPVTEAESSEVKGGLGNFEIQRLMSPLTRN